MAAFELLVIAAHPVSGPRLVMINDALNRIGSGTPKKVHFGWPGGNWEIYTGFESNHLPENLCIIFVMGRGSGQVDDAIIRWLLSLPDAQRERTILWWNCSEIASESRGLGFEVEYNIYSPFRISPMLTIESALRKMMSELPTA